MISSARADQTHPVQTNTPISPLYWVASSVNGTTFFFQVANIGATSIPFTSTIQNALKTRTAPSTVKAATVTVLAGSAGQPTNVTNSLTGGETVRPITSNMSATVSGQNVQLSGTIPALSFSVYRIDL
ncbi:glycoside hydrolase family 51 protein [Sphaerobolus stellatus SS14]|nr:glycoside hydrolase family 51 protein [Sphaerobolus stellatus SS14]